MGAQPGLLLDMKKKEARKGPRLLELDALGRILLRLFAIKKSLRF